MVKKFLIVIFILAYFAFVAVLYSHNNSSYAELEIAAEAYEEREGDSEQALTMHLTDIELLAKTVYGEARGCSTMEQSAVIWCVLNRVDAGYGTIEKVITAPYQFTGYNADNPVTAEFAALAEDVLARWMIEKHCVGEVGRTLPREYLWFRGNGKANIFRDQYDGDYTVWDWNCFNPYDLTIQN